MGYVIMAFALGLIGVSIIITVILIIKLLKEPTTFNQKLSLFFIIAFIFLGYLFVLNGRYKHLVGGAYLDTWTRNSYSPDGRQINRNINF